MWQVNVLFSSINRELPATVVSPNNNAVQNDDGLRIASHWKYKNNLWQSNLITGYVFDQFYYEDRSGDNLNILSEYKVHKLVLNETIARKLNKHIIKFGSNLLADYAKGSDIANNIVLYGAVFTTWKVKILQDKLKISSSIRGEFHSEEKSDIAGIFSFISQPFKKKPIEFKVDAQRNLRYPTINDLFFLPSGNENLNKESSWQYNGSVAIRDKIKIGEKLELNHSHQIEGFSIYLKDMIIWVPTNKIYWQPINLTSAHSRGFKLNNSFSLTNDDKKMVFHFSQFYNFSISTNEANVKESEPLFPNDLTIGKQLPYVPKHQLKLNAYLEYENIFLSVNSQYTSERYITGSNSYFLQKYWMMDALIGYNYFSKKENHNVTFSIGLKNLSGNNYYQEVAHIPMSGRNYQLTISYGFKK